jgi:hypothetical protein
MTNAGALDYIKTIGGLLLSWPTIVLIGIFVLRRHLGPSAERLGEFLSNLRRAKVGPLQFETFEKFVERGESSLSTIEKINVEIAKSRIIELEVSSILFNEEQSKQVALQIENLRKLINQLEGAEVEPTTKPKGRPAKRQRA